MLLTLFAASLSSKYEKTTLREERWKSLRDYTINSTKAFSIKLMANSVTVVFLWRAFATLL